MNSLSRTINKSLVRFLSGKLKIHRGVMERILSLPVIYQQFVNAKWDLNKVWKNNPNIWRDIYIYGKPIKKQVRREIDDSQIK